VAGLERVRRMAEQHAVGGGERERVAGRFFPGQVIGLVHQLPRLHAAELRERAVRRLVAPDALRGRQQRIAAIAILVVAVVLIAVDDDLVADLPAMHLAADRPDDARRIGAGDVKRMLVHVDGGNRLAEAGPDAVVVDPARHHQQQHFVLADRPSRHDFELHGLVRRPVTLLADHPGVHSVGHVPERRNLADVIKVFERSDALHLRDGRHRTFSMQSKQSDAIYVATQYRPRGFMDPSPMLHCNKRPSTLPSQAPMRDKLQRDKTQRDKTQRDKTQRDKTQRDKAWIFRTYAGHSTAAESNALYRKNLAKGQTGLSVAFDLPTQTGYDSDHVLAKGEVGKVGVPVCHLGDMRALFTGIPLATMNTSMTINATAAWLMALYIAVADEQGASRAALTGTIQNDIIKEYLSRGTYVFPPAPSMRLIK